MPSCAESFYTVLTFKQALPNTRFICVRCFCGAITANFGKSGVHIFLSLYCHCFANTVNTAYYVLSIAYEATLTVGINQPYTFAMPCHRVQHAECKEFILMAVLSLQRWDQNNDDHW